MRIFKKYTFNWWEIAILKISVFCLGLAVGSRWSYVFESYFTLLVLVGILLGIYVAVGEFKKSR